MRTPSLYPLSDGALQLIAALLGLALYMVGLVGVKWWEYPGWTWRGYLTDLQAAIGLITFGIAFGAWLFRLYRRKTLPDAVGSQVRAALQSKRLRLIVVSLLVSFCAGIGLLVGCGERLAAPRLFADAEQSNWKHAREELTSVLTQPLRPSLKETLKYFVEVHDLSERDQLKESRSLREDRLTVLQLIQADEDYHGLNSLTYAELSKGLYFVEDAEDAKQRLAEGIQLLTRRSTRFYPMVDRAALLARSGELYLAGKDYITAGRILQEALDMETRPVMRARIQANIGNTHAATGDTMTALELYNVAESAYPEGRRAVFYSNFGYLLMLAKRYAEAQLKVERALQIDPEDWYSYLNLGLIKESLGEYEDATEDFRLVADKSSNPDSRREARIFAGRCLELAGREPTEFLVFYLAAAGRSTALDQVSRLLATPRALSELYVAMANSLEKTNTHGIETYIEWFRARASQINGVGKSET